MRKRNKTMIIIFIVCLSFFQNAKSAAITYEFSGGRFGDNLLAYLHAKWLSFKFGIPLLYKPFEFSDSLMLSVLEKSVKHPDYAGHQPIILSHQIALDLKKKSIFSVPYFSEDPTEFITNPHWIFFKVEWNDMNFKKCMQEMITPKGLSFREPVFPAGMVSVALHIRTGGGFDSPLTSSGLESSEYIDEVFPLKFPSLDFYVEQIKNINHIFLNSPLYIYIFTDDNKPNLLASMLKKKLKGYNILFDFRRSDNSHNKNVLEDFFALTKFECLIRPQSNFSLVAAKLANYKVEIFPVNYYKVGRKPFINKIKMVSAIGKISQFPRSFYLVEQEVI